MTDQINRKDDHVEHALNQRKQPTNNDFDHVRFVHHSLPEMAVSEVSLKTSLAGMTLDVPFFINGMTGGSEWTADINRKLALVAKATGLAMATGSVSSALKHPETAHSYQVVRDIYPDGLVFANLGAEHSVENGQKAVNLLAANAIQIHVNAPQEIIMPEGSRSFTNWLPQIKNMVASVGVPVIVKEVGFGMSQETIQQLVDAGVTTIDISGRGGTNFATIENARREHQDYDFLADWGQSTVISLLEAQPYTQTTEIIASGGIQSPLDIVKSLALGAKACGLSGQILALIQEQGVEETIVTVTQWKEQIKAIMTLLGCATVADLQQTQLILTGPVRDWCEARQIDYHSFATRPKKGRD